MKFSNLLSQSSFHHNPITINPTKPDITSQGMNLLNESEARIGPEEVGPDPESVPVEPEESVGVLFESFRVVVNTVITVEPEITSVKEPVLTLSLSTESVSVAKTVEPPTTTGTVVGPVTIINDDPEITVVLPVKPGKAEFTGTKVEPVKMTSTIPEFVVV